jgi:hypothetical protein
MLARSWRAPADSSRLFLRGKLVLQPGTLEYTPRSAIIPVQYVGHHSLLRTHTKRFVAVSQAPSDFL